MAGWTNRGKYNVLGYAFRSGSPTPPTYYYVALCTSAATPDQDTNTMADLTEIVEGNGYTAGGYALNKNADDFDVYNEDDANDRGDIQIKDVAWTASGGTIPLSGSLARWAVLTNSTGAASATDVLAYWDLSSGRQVSDGQSLTLQNCELRINES